MNKAKIRGTALVVLLIAAALVLGGCEWVGSITINVTDVNGNIVDARSEDLTGVEDVVVTLTPQNVDEENASAKEVETLSDGSFSVLGLPAGSYILTATKDGWFIPAQTVTLGQSTEGINDIPAFRLRPDDLYGLSFIVLWNDQVDDVDIHMSFPTEWANASAPEGFSTPYDFYSSTYGRDRVFWDQKEYPTVDGDTSGDYAYMDRDDLEDGLGPETMNLVEVTHGELPVTYPMSVNKDSDTNGLYQSFGQFFDSSDPANWGTDGWAWLGSAEVYLDAYYDANVSNPNLSTGVEGAAEAVVYAMQTLPKNPDQAADIANNPKNFTETALTASFLGAYRIPEFTTLQSARVLRVNMLESWGDSDSDSTIDNDDAFSLWFQIVPNIQVVPEGPSVDHDQDDSSSDLTFQSAGSGLVGAYAGPRR